MVHPLLLKGGKGQGFWNRWTWEMRWNGKVGWEEEGVIHLRHAGGAGRGLRPGLEDKEGE